MRVTVNRLVAAVPLGVLLGLAAAHFGSALERAWDGNGFKAAGSRLYLGKPLPHPNGRPAGEAASQLLLSIDGKSYETLADAQQLLNVSPAERRARLELWEPSEDREYVVDAPLGELRNRLREIPPAIWIVSVNPAGLADEGGLRRGDLVVAVNGEELGDYHEEDPWVRLNAWVYGWFTPAAQATYHADSFVRRGRSGEPLTYTVLRNDRLVNKRIVLAPQGFHFPHGLVLIIAFAGLLWGCWQLLRAAGPSPVVPMLFAYLLVISVGRSAEYGPGEVVRDLGLALPLIAAALLKRLPPTTVLELPPRLLRGATRFVKPSGQLSVVTALGITVLLTLVGGMVPRWVPAAVKERVIAPGPASVTIFALLACAFVFGVVHLVGIWWGLIRPSRAAERANARLQEAIPQGSVDDLIKLLEQDKQVAAGYYGRRTSELLQAYRINPDVTALEQLAEDQVEGDEDDVHGALAVVRWCEIALPLLGFLGTVVGIGAALPRMSAVIQTGSRNREVMEGLRRAFQDLGLAFDTTLVGLVGVLILGVLHSLVQRRLAANFDDARDVLRRFVARLQPTSLTARLVALEVQAAAALAAMAAAQADRGRVLSTLQKLVSEGNVEPWLEMRRVLNRTLVSFDSMGLELWNKRKEFLHEKGLQEWRLLALAAAADSPLALALLASRGALYLLRFAPAGERCDLLELDAASGLGEHPPQAMVSSPSGRYVAIVTEKQEVWELGIQEKGPVRVRRLVDMPDETTAGAQRQIWAGKAGTSEVLLIAESRARSDLRYQLFGQEHGRVDLGVNQPWSLIGCHSPSAIFALRSENGQASALLHLAAGPPQQGDPRPGSLELVHKGTVVLDTELQFTRVVPLNAAQALLMAEPRQSGQNPKQRLLLVDFRAGGPRPLGHRSDRRPVDEVQVGGDWLALRSGSDLSMWRLTSGGKLDPYTYGDEVKEYIVGAEGERDLLVPSSDGLYLMAASGESISTWSFPRRDIDALRGA